MDIRLTPSPNFNARNPAVSLQYIVLHYTGMASGEAAHERLLDPRAKVSAHYLINEDGRIYQLVDEAARAWHAGKSYWRGLHDLNSASLGIELVNPGHQFGYRPFPAQQIDTLLSFLSSAVPRLHLEPALCLLGHSDIAPGRKEDPGELFPWEYLADEGFGLWPDPTEDDFAPANDRDIQNYLRTIGYNCPDHGDYDRATREALLAFQRHYEPNNLTGTPEKETVARARAMVRRIQKITPGIQNAGMRKS